MSLSSDFTQQQFDGKMASRLRLFRRLSSPRLPKSLHISSAVSYVFLIACATCRRGKECHLMFDGLKNVKFRVSNYVRLFIEN